METGYGKAHSGAVCEIDRLLDKALSERPSAHDDSPVIVLDRTCEDFA